MQLIKGETKERTDGYMYVDTKEWAPSEIQRFGEALCKHEKDFFLVAQEVSSA